MTKILIIIIALLQIADIWTTYRALSSGDGREANPFVRWILDKSGWVGMATFKVTFVAGLTLGSAYIHWIGLVAIIIAYAWIVWRNWQIA